jgi:hypothetical protein
MATSPGMDRMVVSGKEETQTILTNDLGQINDRIDTG